MELPLVLPSLKWIMQHEASALLIFRIEMIGGGR
jgi:hypothetical protein